MKKGRFIVLYGINGIGKSTQKEYLAKHFSDKMLKYPIYELDPTGDIINSYLRKGNPDKLSSREFQILQAMNRTQFEPSLLEILSSGNVVAEDYIGTSFAWGMTTGVDLEWLENLNKHLKKPDLSILLDGKPFFKEHGHFHERDNLLDECRKNFLFLAKRYGWPVVDANQSEQEVHEEILKHI